MALAGKIWTLRGNPLYSKCPSCLSENTLRNSHTRSTNEKILKTISWFDIYRCKKCGWRGWKSNYQLTARILRKVFFYFLLMLLASFIVLNILKLVV
jgi:hypothetical protein